MSEGFAVRHAPVIATIVVSLMLAIAPLPDAVEAYRPDWVAMTLIYWSMHLPRTYSVGTAWLTGIVLDVAQGTLLGQHALGLSLVVYMTVKFHLQMRLFPLSQMTATVLALLAIYRFILFWINGVAGIDAPPVAYWGPVVTGAVAWPVVNFVLHTVPYRQHAGA